MSDKKPELIQGLATAIPEDNQQEPQLVYFQPPKKPKYNVNWLLLWQNESEIGVSIVEQAKMTKPLTQTEYRVRDYLLGTIGIGNYVFVNQSEVARELNINKVNVSRAIKRLVELKILIKGPKSGKSNTYMINPAFCFSGSLGTGIQERKKTIKEEKAKVIQFSEIKKEKN